MLRNNKLISVLGLIVLTSCAGDLPTPADDLLATVEQAGSTRCAGESEGGRSNCQVSNSYPAKGAWCRDPNGNPLGGGNAARTTRPTSPEERGKGLSTRTCMFDLEPSSPIKDSTGFKMADSLSWTRVSLINHGMVMNIGGVPHYMVKYADVHAGVSSAGNTVAGWVPRTSFVQEPTHGGQNPKPPAGGSSPFKDVAYRLKNKGLGDYINKHGHSYLVTNNCSQDKPDQVDDYFPQKINGRWFIGMNYGLPGTFGVRNHSLPVCQHPASDKNHAGDIVFRRYRKTPPLTNGVSKPVAMTVYYPRCPNSIRSAHFVGKTKAQQEALVGTHQCSPCTDQLPQAVAHPSKKLKWVFGYFRLKTGSTWSGRHNGWMVKPALQAYSLKTLAGIATASDGDEVDTGDDNVEGIDEPDAVEPPPPPPASPVGLTAKVGDTQIGLAWSGENPHGVDFYRVYRRVGANPFVVIADGVQNPFFLDTGLTNGVAYDYAVRAVNESGESGSASISAMPIPRPKAPANLASTQNEPLNQVNLTWTPNAAGEYITSYKVYRAACSQCAAGGTYLGASTTSAYTDAPLPGRAYTYQVTAVNAVGEGPPASIIVHIRPKPPTNVAIISGTNREVRLTWTRPVGYLGGFNIYANGVLTTIYTHYNLNEDVGTASRPVGLTVRAGVPTSIQVETVALDSDLKSDWSSAVSVTTMSTVNDLSVAYEPNLAVTAINDKVRMGYLFAYNAATTAGSIRRYAETGGAAQEIIYVGGDECSTTLPTTTSQEGGCEMTMPSTEGTYVYMLHTDDTTIVKSVTVKVVDYGKCNQFQMGFYPSGPDPVFGALLNEPTDVSGTSTSGLVGATLEGWFGPVPQEIGQPASASWVNYYPATVVTTETADMSFTPSQVITQAGEGTYSIRTICQDNGGLPLARDDGAYYIWNR